MAWLDEGIMHCSYLTGSEARVQPQLQVHALAPAWSDLHHVQPLLETYGLIALAQEWHRNPITAEAPETSSVHCHDAGLQRLNAIVCFHGISDLRGVHACCLEQGGGHIDWGRPAQSDSGGRYMGTSCLARAGQGLCSCLAALSSSDCHKATYTVDVCAGMSRLCAARGGPRRAHGDLRW